MKYIIHWTWGIIQNLLGLLLFLIFLPFKVDKLDKYHEALILVCKRFPAGISLGMFIIMNKNCRGTYFYTKHIAHEYGHTKQSLILGPLYLLIVGIPSMVMNILTRLKLLRYGTYYERFPEKWADELGGVNR